MQKIGLYYPYIHLRDTGWIKAAALYRPRLARMVPSGYPVDDSIVVRTLTDELDFLLNVEPDAAARDVAPLFLDFLRNNIAQVVEEYGVSGSGIRSVSREPHLRGVRLTLAENWGLSGVHWSELDAELRQVLIDSGLAVEASDATNRTSTPRPWIAMDPMLAWVYKCALADELARQNGLEPTTDQVPAHLGVYEWDRDRISSTLLGAAPPVDPGDPVGTVGFLAVKLAVPRNLEDIPISKIVELRRKHATEFEAFEHAISEAADDLGQASRGVCDQKVLQAYVESEIRHRFDQPLKNLQGAMRGLKLGTALGIANLKFEIPALTLLGVAADRPLVMASAAAFGIASLCRSAAQVRNEKLRGNPTAYLLRISGEFGPKPANWIRGLAAKAAATPPSRADDLPEGQWSARLK
ncbi:DUF6236 family protein [Streptomyces sp. NBC_00885]|uniref:DUF6236 family protein n=1 Tax=Streptomyces sp. NBC_00885 TaxID=2975857 RepID=UPI00386EB6EC|nr:DUF6236 family protein [Streptomyces sp. NBC_00885]